MKSFQLIIILLTPVYIFSQTAFSYGPEVGFNISGIPYIEKYENSDRGDKMKDRYLPLVSPAIGGFASLHAGKHFLVSTGVQYKMIGTRNHFHKDGNKAGTGGAYTSDEYYQQTFHTFSSPILIGYNFFIREKQFQLSTGYVCNYFIAGKHYEKNVFDEAGGEFIETEKVLNPFDKNDFEIPAARWNNQVSLALSYSLNEKLNLSFNSSLGKEIYYLEYRPDYCNSWCSTGWGKSFLHLDFCFTAKYNLIK